MVVVFECVPLDDELVGLLTSAVKSVDVLEVDAVDSVKVLDAEEAPLMPSQ